VEYGEHREQPTDRSAEPQLTQEGPWVDRILRGSQVGIDALALIVAFVLGYIARRYLPLFPVLTPNPPGLRSYSAMLIVHVVTLVMIFFFARLYHQRRAASRIDTAYTIAASVSIGVVMTSGLITIFLKGMDVLSDYPRQMVFYVWLFSIVCVIVGREVQRLITIRARVKGVARDRVLIVGSGEVARAIVQQIQTHPELGYAIVGAVNGSESKELAGVSVIGHKEDLPQLIDAYNVDEVIIALPEASHKELIDLISRCQRGRVSIKIYPDLFAYMTGGMSVDELGGMPLLSVRDVALRGWKLSLKRGVDIIGASVGLVLLSPALLITAILIKLESPGPVFFYQERFGLDGRPFPMFKFRSMRQDAEVNGPGWTTKGDPRVTRIGRWMRMTDWDELPNLINVLLGQMSLVGPRAEQSYFVQKFREYIPRYMERHREKAGMTGWAQVNGLRGDTSVEERTKYDVWYVENWSLWLDIKIIIRTIVQTVLRNNPGAY
jgi:exopolysaccharide biosynthesis polyprenyl glycosylphosphotransferase